MATLFNTLLASLFSTLLGTPIEEPFNPSLSERTEVPEVTVKEESEFHYDLKIYFYQSV